jgi:HlyD family secretion protein
MELRVHHMVMSKFLWTINELHSNLKQVYPLAVSIVVAVLLAACGAAASQPEFTPEPQIKSYQPVINVTGKVVPYTWAELSPAASGKVARLAVEENQPISAGQVLLVLEDIQDVQSKVSAAEIGVLLAQQDLDLLYEKVDLQRAQVQADLVNARHELEEAVKSRSRKDLPRADQDRLDKALAEYYISLNGVKTAEDVFFDFYDLDEEHLARNQALIDLAQAREERDARLAALNWYLGQPGELEIAASDVRVGLAQANLQELEHKWIDLERGPDPESLRLAEMVLNEARKKLDSANQMQADLQLTAPFSGTISRVDTRPLEWVDAGQPVFLLADLVKMKVETSDLNEIDVARIDVGNAARINFDAFPDVVIPGRVEKIALKSDQGSGVNYTVDIALLEQPPGLKWDMTAFADIEVTPK